MDARHPTSRSLALLCCACTLAWAAACWAEDASPPPTAWVIDRGWRPKAYATYLGQAPGQGWQDLYNQDERGAYYLERELEFGGVRIPFRLTQAFVGDESRPTGRLALRFAKGGLITPTQPVWLSTWCRHDDKYPGLLDVSIGKKGLGGVPLSFQCGRIGALAFVRANWSHEDGAVTATFAMLPDDDRIFCEVAVTPKADAQVAVSLCCWPIGQFSVRTSSGYLPALTYGKPQLLPADSRTLIFADPKFDPDGRIAEGACALTYLTEECQSATMEQTFPLFITLKPPTAAADSTVYCHFALWELLCRRGEAAFSYVMDREMETMDTFECIAAFSDPKLVAKREGESKDVLDKLRAFDRLRKTIPAPAEPAMLVGESWRVPDRSLNRRWAAHYREQADYCLSYGDWRGALRSATLALDFVQKVARDTR